MAPDVSIAVIGGGAMGEAIVLGWISSGAMAPEQIAIVESSAARRQHLSHLERVAVTESPGAALPADIVMLAVKPQVIEALLAETGVALAGGLVVSIAAGWSTAHLESLLPAGTRVVRVMPNMPAMAAQGMAIVSGGSEASAADVETVTALFSAIGQAVAVDERHQNAATAISGSGPAYFALVVDALARAGVDAGLPRDVAQTLAIQTMLGTAALLQSSGMHPEALVDSVASPGGTTIAALAELEAGGVRTAFNRAVRAAVACAEELGS